MRCTCNQQTVSTKTHPQSALPIQSITAQTDPESKKQTHLNQTNHPGTLSLPYPIPTAKKAYRTHSVTLQANTSVTKAVAPSGNHSQPPPSLELPSSEVKVSKTLPFTRTLPPLTTAGNWYNIPQTSKRRLATCMAVVVTAARTRPKRAWRISRHARVWVVRRKGLMDWKVFWRPWSGRIRRSRPRMLAQRIRLPAL